MQDAGWYLTRVAAEKDEEECMGPGLLAHPWLDPIISTGGRAGLCYDGSVAPVFACGGCSDD